MKQVKVISKITLKGFESTINDFLATTKMTQLIDIKYQQEGGAYLAMIIYEV